MKGEIFNIQRFCINDGPGIRTTVFLKGCPLKCLWCHNPESHSLGKQILFYSDRCTYCGKCKEVCKNNAHILENGVHLYNRSLCTKCGLCTSVCHQNAMEISGKTVSEDDVLEDIVKDKVFYDNSGGGLTLSGGEPLLQFEFSYILLQKVKEHDIHTCVETSGFTEYNKILKISEYTDIFLYDWKITDNRLHKEYTGESNEQIKENLYAIDRAGAKVILRCPIIPGINDNNEHFSGIAEIANSLDNILGIEIELYHSLGSHKYEKLGKNIETFKVPSKDEIERWVKEIQSKTRLPVKKA